LSWRPVAGSCAAAGFSVAFLGQVMSLPMEKSMGKSMGNLVFFMWKWENLWEKYGASNGKIIKVNGKVQDPNIEHPLEKPCFFYRG
jgi:hypothetical protein